MKTALFINIDTIPFTGFWDGKPKTFKAGQEMYMPEYLARHFAKHLTNKLLLDKGLENYTSPKKPEQVPQFMEIFSRCFKADEETATQDELDAQIDAENRNREPSMSVPEHKEVAKPDVQVAKFPEDEDENAEFPELKNEALASLS